MRTLTKMWERRITKENLIKSELLKGFEKYKGGMYQERYDEIRGKKTAVGCWLNL